MPHDIVLTFLKEEADMKAEAQAWLEELVAQRNALNLEIKEVWEYLDGNLD
jgi:hypothetical protein